jgi:hypothetical protein
MRRTNKQLRLAPDSRVVSTTLTDTAGNPSESYYWRQMAAVRRESQHELWRPCTDTIELTLAEIRGIEAKVRSELYP